MKRKIIKLGTATLVASLPAKWIREFGLKQGDYLEVEERKGDLILSTEKEIAKSEKKIDIKGMNTKLASYFLEAAYCMGYDRIEILHDAQMTEYKTHRKVKTSEFIQDAVNLWIGIEIIEQSESRTLLKDLGGVSDMESDNILRRIFLLTKWMSAECLEAVKKKNVEELKAINVRTKNIFKFLVYYNRILNKKGYKDFNKTAVMYKNIRVMEEMVEILNYIAKESQGFKKRYSDEAISVFTIVNASIEKMDNLFFDFKNEKAMPIIEDREKIWLMINKAKDKCQKEDAFLYSKLAMIVMGISDMTVGRFYLEL